MVFENHVYFLISPEARMRLLKMSKMVNGADNKSRPEQFLWKVYNLL